MIWLCSASLLRAAKVYGPANRDDVLNEAVDPEPPIMVDIDLVYQCDTREAEYAVANLMYHQYLKTRRHVYVHAHSFELVLNDTAWQQALEWNLFREYEGQSLLVALDDVETLKKCFTLRWLCNIDPQAPAASRAMQLLVEDDLKALRQRYRVARIMRSYVTQSMKWPSAWRNQERVGLTDLQVFKLRLADFLMEIHGIVEANSGMGEEIMELDGRFREGHPLVEEFQLRLPEFHPVVVFEAVARRRP